MTTRELLVVRHCRVRNVASRNALVDGYRHLCERAARKFAGRGTDRADLEQIGAIGLIKAADNYRLEMKTPFEGYAWVMIVGELMHYVRDHERPIRVPRAVIALQKKANTAWERLSIELGREPSVKEIALAIGAGVAEVEELAVVRRRELLPLPDANEAAAEPARCATGLSLEDRLALGWGIAELGDRERTIVLGTFGAGLTQTELATRLGLSQSHVSKLLARALRRLGTCVA